MSNNKQRKGHRVSFVLILSGSFILSCAEHLLAASPLRGLNPNARRFLLRTKSLINFLKLQIAVLPAFPSKDVLLGSVMCAWICYRRWGSRGKVRRSLSLGTGKMPSCQETNAPRVARVSGCLICSYSSR